MFSIAKEVFLSIIYSTSSLLSTFNMGTVRRPLRCVNILLSI